MRSFIRFSVFIFSFFSLSASLFAATPTMHSILGHGNWNDPQSWNELRVPASDDVVEINGVINLNTNTTVAGVVVNGWGQLNGNYNSITVSGDIINDGIWSVGNLYTTNPTTPQILQFNNTLTGNLLLQSNLSILGDLNISGKMDFQGGTRNIQLEDGKGITSKSGFTSGTAIISGANTFMKTQGYTSTITITGSLENYIFDNKNNTTSPASEFYAYVFNISAKNIRIEEGSNIYIHEGSPSNAFSGNTFTIPANASLNVKRDTTIKANIINNGTILGSASLVTNGNIENNGTWSVSRTYAIWTNSGASSYTIRFDPGTSTGFTTSTPSYEITNKIAGSYYYTVTPNNAGAYPRKCINISGCIANTGNNNPSVLISSIIPAVPQDVLYFGYSSQTQAPLVFNVDQNQSHTTQPNDQLDPVDLATGNFTYSNTLMHLVGNTLDYDFGIHYQSQVEYLGPLGYNWDFVYNKKLITNTGGSVTYSDGKFHKYTFTQSGSTYVPLSGINATLSKTASGNFTIDFVNGERYSFGANNKISEIRNQYNKTITFAYGTGGELMSTTDSIGRNISYTYNTGGLLSQVSESGGKYVTISYYGSGDTLGGSGDLRSISIGDTHTSEKKVISFTYSTGSDSKLAHNMLTMTDSKGLLYVTNIYDTNDRVLSQKYGDHSGSYVYTLADIHEDDTPTTVGTGKVIGTYVRENLATDRNGNTTRYVYNRTGNVESRTTAGIMTQYAYDSKGQLISETRPNGNGIKYAYDDRGNKIVIRKKANMNIPDDDTTDIITRMTYTGAINTIATLVDPLGRVTTFDSDSHGNITRIHKSGDSLTPESVETYEYDTSGRITRSVDSLGMITEYDYNTLGQPISIKRASGTPLEAITSYTYDTYGNPLTTTDARGNTTTFSYDAFDRLIRSTTSEGIVSDRTYDANNNNTDSKKTIGASQSVDTHTTYNLLDKPTTITSDIDSLRQASISYAYDNNDNLLETTYPNGQRERRVYDALGRLTQKDIIGSTTRTTSYAYDANGNVLTETINGVTSVFTYDGYDRLTTSTDALGTITRLSYDKAGNIIESSIRNQADTLLAKTSTTYNLASQALQIKEYGSGTIRTTEKTYDSAGHILSETDPLARVTTMTYDILGRLSRTTLSNGLESVNIYDKNNNLIQQKIISPDKTLTTTSVYDRDNRKTSTTDPSGNTTTYTYNQLDQVISIVDPKGIATIYEYDYRGKVTSETRAGKTISRTYDLMGNLVSLTDALGNTTTYTYNQNNELTRETLPDSNTTTYTYDNRGNIQEKTDPNGTITTYTYDDLNRITRKDYTLGQGVGGVTYETYTYDALGRLVNSTDSSGKTISFTYDLLGNLLSETNGGKTIEYGYDLSGNKSTTLTPSGRSISNIYDTMNRITSVKRDTMNIATYTYDELNLQKETLGNGVETNYGYDAGNRIIQVGSESLTYDPNSNITRKGTDTYVYDTLNQVTQSMYGNTRFGTGMQGNGYDYDLMGNRYNEQNIRILTKTTRTGAVIITEKKKIWNYEINSLNQYSDILAQSGATTPTNTGITNTGSTNTGVTNTGTTNTGSTNTGEINTGTVMNTASGGSGDGTVGVSTGTATGGAELPSLTSPETFGTFSLESTGSTSSGETSTGELSPESTGSTESGSTNSGETNTGETNTGVTDTGSLISDTGSLAGRLLYDKNGNLIGNILNLKREYEYTYDAQNRLISVSRYNSVNLKEVLISYTYDTLGRRTSKKIQNQLTEYIYSGNDVIEETMSTVNPTSGVKVKKELREYVYGSKGMDDIISVTITPYTRVNKVDVAGISNTYYYEKDHLGSITKISTSTGGIVDEYSYTVFGKAYKKNDLGVYKPVSSLKSTIGNTRLYTGREYDRETNLYYLRARYYDASLGRFINRDPIGMQDDINLYKYTRNSPINYTDRDGKASKSVLIIKGVETNNENFGYVRDATKVAKKRLNSNGVSDNMIQEINAQDFNNFKSIFDEIDKRNIKYDQIIIVAHGSPGSMLLGDGDNGHLNKKNVSQIHMNSEFNTPTNLESCETGYGDNSIGELLAKQLGTTVMAPDNFVAVYGGEDMRVEGFFYGQDNDGFKQTVREFLLPDRYFELGKYNTFSY